MYYGLRAMTALRKACTWMATLSNTHITAVRGVTHRLPQKEERGKEVAYRINPDFIACS